MHILKVAFLVGTFLAGCGGMTTGSAGMREAVDEARTETNAYRSAAFSVTMMPAMLDESTRHVSRMNRIVDDMGVHMMGTMGHCSSVRPMMELRDEMHAELVAHDTTMHTMTTMDGARAEVGHHTTTMTGMLNGMDAMLDGSHCTGW